MKAMIFAAGLGTRLRPLTDTVPKALIEVGGVTMLQRVINSVIASGITEIVVNVHHHADKVKEYIDSIDCPGVSIKISDESELLLDTGGGVAKAAGLLGYEEDILLHNADIYTDIDLRQMMAQHTGSGAEATLLAGNRNTSRYLLFSPGGRMTGWRNVTTQETRSTYDADTLSSSVQLAFGGIHIISPDILRLLVEASHDTPCFSITQFYISHCARLDIRAFIPAGQYNWIDIGRPQSLEQARKIASNI